MAETKIVIKANDKTKKAFASVNKGLGGLRAGVNSTQLKVGLLAGVAGFGALIRSSSKTADELAKVADKLGVSTEALAGLQNAAEITGVSQETLNKALTKQAVAVSDYSNGIGLAKREFEQLGFAQNDLMKLSVDEQFIAISEALKGVENSTERVNIAYKIYGGRATDLLNTLDLGEEGLRKFREESELLGTSLSRIDSAKIEASNDAFARIGQAFKGFGLQITAKLAPLLEVVANRFVSIAKESGGMGAVAGNVFESLITGIGYVANAFRGMEIIWQGLRVAFAGLWDFVIGGLDDLQTNIVGFINMIPGVDITPFEGLKNAADAIGSVSVDAQAKLLDLMTQPLPSDNIKQWSAEVQAEATLAAEKIAATKAGAGGGDVGSVDIGDASAEKDKARLAEKFERLNASLLSEQERLRLANEEKQFIIEEAFQEGMSSDAERKEQLLAIEGEYQSKLTTINNKGMSEREKFASLSAKNQTKQVVGELVAMTQGVANQNKTMFRINKIAGIANATISTYEGVTKTLGAYPQPLAGILAAGHLAAGLAQIAAIKSTSFSGGGKSGGGGFGGGSVPPSSAGSGVSSIVGTSPFGGEEKKGGGTVKIYLSTSNLVDDEALARIVDDKVVPIIRDGVENRDVILVTSGSRNAQELQLV